MTYSTTFSRRGLWSILSAAILWGTTGVATQAVYNLNPTNPLSVAFLRLAIGALVLLLLCWRHLGQRMWLIKRLDALLMLFLGAMQAVFQFCYLAAIPACGISIATLVALCVAPLIVVFYSVLFQHDQITLKTLLALACALAGTALLIGLPSSRAAFRSLLTGVLLALISAAGYAGTILGGRAISVRSHPLQVNTASFGIGALLLLACSFTTHLVFKYSAQSWLLLLYMGCIPTALAYILFQAGMRYVPATMTSILTLCEPLTAAILAWILFGEHLGLPGILGALLLLGTILLLAQSN